MRDYNRVILLGRLGKDPEVRYAPSGTAICSFSLATGREWTGKDGKKEKVTDWHNIVVFGKTAEACGQYLKKGSRVLIDGEIRYETYEKERVKKYTTKIYTHHAKFLDPTSGGESKEIQTERVETDDIPF